MNNERIASGFLIAYKENVSVPTTAEEKSKWRWKLIILSWFAALGVDFIWHGGVLAEIYSHPHPAILDSMQLFIRIPFGYLSFFLQAVFLYWFASYLQLHNWKDGLKFGFIAGCVMGIASVLGQYSVLTVELFVLILWGIGQLLGFLIMGAVFGAGKSVDSLRNLTKKVAAFVAVMLILGIILQNMLIQL
ncbi:MAG: hypothetical protein ACFFF4_17545 [Candidatus Thorarchaeota archaeon]